MNSKGFFWGTFLILLGVFILLKKLGLIFFHIDWILWAKLWPVLIILIGIRLLLPKDNKAIGYILILSVVGIFAFSVYEGFRYNKNLQQAGNGGFFAPDNDDDNQNKPDSSDWDPVDTSNHFFGKGSSIKQNFKVPLSSEIKKAHLNLQGGAARFNADFTHASIFEAATLVDESVSYRLERSNDGDTENIKLVSENQDHNINLGDKDNTNQVKIRLNPDILWNMDFNIGAGKVDYDFSGYKIETLNFHSGLTAVDLKLGRLNTKTYLNVETGLASFHLMVPQSSGCKIHMDGALSSKQFDGFKKIDDENYKTANYDSADRKIDIHINGGISAITIDQY